jgi:hypothetical protein
MISTLIVTGLTVLIVGVCKWRFHYPTWSRLALFGVVGVILGAILDIICGYSLGWYYYVHHTWWSNGYFGYVYPCWGMNLLITICLFHILKSKVKSWPWRITTMLCLALFEEIMGLVRNSWQYEINVGLILLGWFSLIALSVLIKYAVDWLSEDSVVIIRNLEIPE